MRYILLLMLCCNAAFSALPVVVSRPWAQLGADDSAAQTKIFRSQNIAIMSFVAELKKSNILAKDVKYITDQQTNEIWVTADHKTLVDIAHWLKVVDKAPQQISIRARIVYIDNNQLQHLGLTLQQSETNTSSDDDGIHIPILHFHDSAVLDAQIDALKQKGYAKIVASPELLTTNNTEASISSGDEIPYQEKASMGSTSASFKKAVMLLSVTPSVLADNHLTLSIHLNQDQVSKSLVNGVPLINTRELKTVVRLSNNQTVVLGGIQQTRVEKSHGGIPFLSDIPVLGYLFGRRSDEQQRQSLWIILTPHIVSRKT
jgi:type II secretory pathway component HofQ